MREKVELAVCVLLLLVVVFFLGRNSKKDVVLLEPTDISKYENNIDSLKSVIAKKDTIVLNKQKVIDSIKVSIKNNHKKVLADVEKIRSYSNPEIDRWNDSILRTNGLK